MISNILAISDPKFPLGDLVSTRNAADKITHEEIQQGIVRHVAGDWGDLCDEDVATNDYNLRNNGRLMSVYKTEDEVTFWIITESDRSVTTVLLPKDY